MAIVFKDERGVQYVGRVLRQQYDANVRIMSDVWAGVEYAICVELDGSTTRIPLSTEGFGRTLNLVSFEVDATPEAIAAHKAYCAEQARIAAELDAARVAARIAAEEKAVRKGRRCVVRRGRKVPKGTMGICIWVGDGHYGERCGIKDDAGTVHWTASKNCEAIVGKSRGEELLAD